MDDKNERVSGFADLELTPVYSFQIDNDNMEDLARLADKYIIDSLQNDVRVRPFDDPLTRLELHI